MPESSRWRLEGVSKASRSKYEVLYSLFFGEKICVCQKKVVNLHSKTNGEFKNDG